MIVNDNVDYTIRKFIILLRREDLKVYKSREMFPSEHSYKFRVALFPNY